MSEEAPKRIENCTITKEEKNHVTVEFKEEEGPDWACGKMVLNRRLAPGSMKGDKGILKYVIGVSYAIWVFERRPFDRTGRKWK